MTAPSTPGATGATGAAPRPITREGLVDYVGSLDCIHCGLCLHTCPTYQLTGAEASSPRGRVHLMRAVAEGRLEPDAAFREEMDFCLVCRHCESVCPAGVEFGSMMEFTRGRLLQAYRGRLLGRLARGVGLGLVLAHRRGLRLASAALRWAQVLGLTRLAARLGGERGRALAALPRVPPRSERRPLPRITPALGERRGQAAMLEGCVMVELLGRVNRATARCLAAAGVEVHCAGGHTCCGALHAHNGDLEGARDLARRTIEAFEPLPGALVVNSAGCGAHMAGYGRLLEDDAPWRERAARFAERVVDLAVFLARPERRERLLRRATHAPAPVGPVAWDDPCHLCHGQQVRAQPRELLDALPGLERVELERAESCCGSAGIWSLQRPADSRALLDAKLEDLRASGARVLVTANPGCHLQWLSGVRRAGLDVEVLHLAEVLERALAE